MRIIALANQKGGCGKTTVSINLAAALANEGRRVVLVDMDPQGHCGLGLAVPEEQVQHSIADMLLQDQGGSPVELEQVVWRISNCFDLIPATLGLVRFETVAAAAEDRDLLLRNVLDGLHERYDYCLIDTPPHVGLLTYNALRAAEEVIIPVDTGYFSLHGLDKAMDTITDLDRRAGTTHTVYVLPNCYDVRTRLAREILNELRRRHETRLLKSYINFNSKLKEGASYGQAISEYDPASTGCRDFTRLARELIEREPRVTVQDELLTHVEQLSARAEALLATRATLLDPAPPALATAQAAALSMMAAAPAVHARPETPPSPPRTAPTRPQPHQPQQPAMPRTAVPAVPVSPGRNGVAPRPAVAEHAAVDHARIGARIDRIYGIHQTSDGVEFATRLPGAREVLLAGDFNNWSPRECPMADADGSGRFTTTLQLDSGRYRYRLVVDGRWQKDPCNDLTEVNEFGEVNSIAEIT